MAMITIYSLDERGERTTFDFQDFADLPTATGAAPEYFRRWTRAASLEFNDGLEARRIERPARLGLDGRRTR